MRGAAQRDQSAVDVVQEEEPLQLGAGGLLGELPVRLGLLISQKLHRHEADRSHFRALMLNHAADGFHNSSSVSCHTASVSSQMPVANRVERLRAHRTVVIGAGLGVHRGPASAWHHGCRPALCSRAQCAGAATAHRVSTGSAMT